MPVKHGHLPVADQKRMLCCRNVLGISYTAQIAEYLGPIWVLSGLTGAHIPQIKPRWDADGRAHSERSHQVSHIWAPHWIHVGPMCVVFGGFLVGWPRWDADGRAHSEPTKSNTYGPHIGFMWGPCVLVLVGFW